MSNYVFTDRVTKTSVPFKFKGKFPKPADPVPQDAKPNYIKYWLHNGFIHEKGSAPKMTAGKSDD